MRSRGDYAWRCGDWRVGTAQGRYAGVAGARDGSPVLRSRCARLAGCHGACLSQRREAPLGKATRCRWIGAGRRGPAGGPWRRGYWWRLGCWSSSTARIRAPAADSWDGRFALGAGALWVGTGADTIRVDVRTGRPSRVRVAAWAVAPDGLWSCQTPAQGRPAGLVRVDPRTLAETTRIPVPACPAALAAERGLVWAIDEPGRRVLRVDAASAHLTEIGLPVAPFAVSPTGPGLVALAVGAGAVWALSDQVESPTRLGARVGPGLVRIDPTSARVTGVTPLANLDAAGQALAVGAGGVWVAGVPVAPQGGARGSFVLDRVDPRSGRLLGSFTVAQLEFGFGPQLAVGFGALWLSTFDSGELLRVDPSRM